MQSSSLNPARTLGDAAASGLTNGLIAGVVMAAYVGVAGALLGVDADRMFASLAPAARNGVMLGVLLHMAISAAYGTLFGVLLRALGRAPAWVLGLAYGILLSGFAQIMPAVRASLAQLPLAHVVLAHALYGLVLGWRMR